MIKYSIHGENLEVTKQFVIIQFLKTRKIEKYFKQIQELDACKFESVSWKTLGK